MRSKIGCLKFYSCNRSGGIYSLFARSEIYRIFYHFESQRFTLWTAICFNPYFSSLKIAAKTFLAMLLILLLSAYVVLGMAYLVPGIFSYSDASLSLQAGSLGSALVMAFSIYKYSFHTLYKVALFAFAIAACWLSLNSKMLPQDCCGCHQDQKITFDTLSESVGMCP